MCVAFPGRVTKIDGNTAEIDYGGNKVEADCSLAELKVGDWALVHAGFVIQVLSEEEGTVMQQLFEEIEEAAEDGN